MKKEQVPRKIKKKSKIEKNSQKTSKMAIPLFIKNFF